MPPLESIHLRRSLEAGKVPVSVLQLRGPDIAVILKVKESGTLLGKMDQNLSTNRDGAGSLRVLAVNHLPLGGNRLVGSEFALRCD